MPRARTDLTTADVVAMREALANQTATIGDLALRYEVHPTTIVNIAAGKTWNDAGGPLQPLHTGPRSNTGYWGVTANGAGNRFWVMIRIDRRQVSLGYTRCPIEGARRYDAVARELGYPPEKLNFPDEAPSQT